MFEACWAQQLCMPARHHPEGTQGERWPIVAAEPFLLPACELPAHLNLSIPSIPLLARMPHCVLAVPCLAATLLFLPAWRASG